MIVFIDVETVDLQSPLLSIQWAFGAGDPEIRYVWKEPVEGTLSLIESFCDHTVCAWNLPFDWFHLTKWWNILNSYQYLYGNEVPIPEKAKYVERFLPSHWCLKPKGAIDLKIAAQKGEFQVFMKRRPLTLRKIPVDYVDELIELIDDETELPRGVRVHWIKGIAVEGFVDIKANFRSSLSLKDVYAVITGGGEGKKAKDVFDLPKRPFAPPHMPHGGDWVAHVNRVKDFTEEQVEYALKDVTMMQEIYEHMGKPMSDVDSTLTPLIASARWKGYSVDKKAIEEELEKTQPNDEVPTAPRAVQTYLKSALDPFEMVGLGLEDSTKKEILEEIVLKWPKEHPARKRANLVLKERKRANRRNVLNMLKKSCLFHPELKVMGTLSNRMAGGGTGAAGRGGRLNPHGISRDLRHVFTLAHPSTETLSGGDFSGFEVSIADAVWKSKKLREALLTGKKIHGLFGASVFGKTYEEIIGSDLYHKAKTAFFAKMYGAQAPKLASVLGLEDDKVEEALNKWEEDYPEIGEHYVELRAKYRILDDEYTWADPFEGVVSILGFARSFEVEVSFAHTLYKVSEDLPREWKRSEETVCRRDKEQSIGGAIRSALLGAIYSTQHRLVRVAGNHEIQSPGAEITKLLQAKLWELQPPGIHPWEIRTLNIHDELMVVHDPTLGKEIELVVENFVQEMKATIPLLSMEWKTNLKNWEEVK